MNLMLRCLLAAAFAPCIAVHAGHAQRPAARSDCAAELKPADTYKELSAMLQCLNDRIRAFEASRAPRDPARRGARPMLRHRRRNARKAFWATRSAWS